MANAPGWLPDPERPDQERYWSGSTWTDRVRPAGRAGSLHLAEHVPELQRALAASTADIDAVEDRLSTLFDRPDGAAGPASGRRPASTAPATPATQSGPPPAVGAPSPTDDDDMLDLYEDDDMTPGEVEERITGETLRELSPDPVDADFAELDAALAAEQPDETDQPGEPKRRLFRRS